MKSTKKFGDIKQQLLADKYVKEWIKGLDNHDTIRNYLIAISDFSIAIDKTPTEIMETCYAENKKPEWEQQIYSWLEDLDNYYDNRDDLATSTANRRRSYIKGFIRANRFNLKKIGKPRRGKQKTVNERDLPDKEDVKSLLDACNSIKQKSIILVQFSSGMSSVDVCNITVGQFREGIDNDNICTLKMKRQKADRQFVTFLSPEAVESVQLYLKVERDNVENEQPLFTKFKGDEKLSSIAIVGMYRFLNDSLGWDKGSNKYRNITSHMGRKWFKTRLTNDNMPDNPLKAMMGHKLPGLDDNYYLDNVKALKKLYLIHLPAITIQDTKTHVLESEEYKKLNEKLEEESKKSRELEEQIKFLRTEMGLKDGLYERKKKLDELGKKIG